MTAVEGAVTRLGARTDWPELAAWLPESAHVRRALAALLAVDVGFFVLTVLNHADVIGGHGFYLDQEYGAAPLVQIGMLGTTAVLLWVTAAQPRVRLLAVWAAVFTYVSADDGLRIHEWGGRRWSAAGLFGVGPVESYLVGEMVTFAVAGVVIVATIVWASRRLDDPGRRDNLLLWGALGALVIAGTVMDVVHTVFEDTKLDVFLEIAEDGGELVASTFAVAYAADIFLRRRAPVV
jgi:hypothetical protein